MHIQLIDGRAVGLHLFSAPSLSGVSALDSLICVIRKLLNTPGVDISVITWGTSSSWREALRSESSQTPLLPPAEYLRQETLAKTVLAHLPIIQLDVSDGEGGDLAWGLSRQFARQGHLTTVVSPNLGLLQVVDTRVEWLSLRAPKQLVSASDFSKTSGGFSAPGAVGPILALCGDASINILGVTGISLRHAQALISKFKTIEYLLYSTQDFLKFSQEPDFAQALMLPENKKLIALNIKLTDISRCSPIRSEDCQLVAGTADFVSATKAYDEGLNEEGLQGAFAWNKAMDRPLNLGATQAVSRALARISDSWAGRAKG